MAARRGSTVSAGLVILACVLGSSLAGPATPAAADPVSDQKRSVDSQIAEVKEELEGASEDLVTAAVGLKSLQAQLVTARTTLAAAQQARSEALRRDAELAARLTLAQAQLAKAERDIAAQREAEEQTRAALGRIAREAYAGNGLNGMSVALQATTPEQFTERMAVASAALRAQGGAIDRMAVVQAELRARLAKLDALRAQIVELKEQSALVVEQRKAAERAAVSAEAQVSALVADETAQVASIQGKIAAEKARLGALEAEQAKLQAVLVARAKAAREAAAKRRRTGTWTPPSAGGFLSYPAPGGVTSGFGMRYHPILHYARLHSGVDFGVACGTPVHAAADGEIVSAGRAGGYGNRVVIDHGEVGGGDLATTYNHLTSIVVGGGTVRRGQVIAYSGTTGLSTGCHLHFETLVDGRYVNPMNYL